MDFKGMYQRYEASLGTIFENYGSFVAKYPWRILIGCLILNFCLVLGLMRVQMETDIETLYTPMNNRALLDRNRLQKLFQDSSGDNFHVKSITNDDLYAEIIIKTKNNSNIIHKDYLQEMKAIDRFVRESVFFKTEERVEVGFKDVCAVRNGTCYVGGSSLLFSEGFQTFVAAGRIPYPLFFGIPISSIFGNISTSKGDLVFASMVRFTYFLRQHSIEAQLKSRKWEQAFKNHVKDISSNLTEVAYMHSDSVNEELDNNITGDIRYFTLTIVFMIIYTSLATSGGDCVSSRQNLGRAGVLATLLAIVAAIGLISGVGVRLVNIVGVVPFLIIGIGIDDMFILMAGMSSCPATATINDKMKQTMKTSGVAITITSLTDFLAFAVGATSSFLGVRNFCLYIGVAILFCYLNQLFFFLPCMVINERRTKAGRHCVTCLPTSERQELKQNGASTLTISCCGGSVPTEIVYNENFLEKYPRMFFQKTVSNLPCRIIIIFCFIGYLVLSIMGICKLELGLKLINLVTSDSYFYTFSSWEKHFTSEMIVTFVIQSTVEYTNITTQNQISDLLQLAKRETYIDSDFEINWLSAYQKSPWYNNTEEQVFIDGLRHFLSHVPHFQSDVLLRDDNSAIMASRVYVATNSIKDFNVQGTMMLRMREIADASSLPVFAYAPIFVFLEQYVAILPVTLQTVGYAVFAIFVVTAVFMPHPLLVSLVSFSLISILVGIFGFMFYWDLSLSSITMLQLIMSIGFSVDFSAHIAHAYITTDHSDRSEKVRQALGRSGGPIFNSAMSSLVGISMLVTASSYIFQSFFKLMLLVILFGLVHAVFLIPIFLTYFGPVSDRNTVMDKLNDSPDNAESKEHTDVSQKRDADHKEELLPVLIDSEDVEYVDIVKRLEACDKETIL